MGFALLACHASKRSSLSYLSDLQSEAASAEMLEMLSDFLPREYPDYFRKDGNVLTAIKTGEIFDLDNLGMDPLEASARLVQVSLPDTVQAV